MLKYDLGRREKYAIWSNKVLKKAARAISRLSRSYNIDRTIRLRRISKNTMNEKKINREKFGILIHNSSREALLLDKENGNSFWAESTMKEMTALDTAGCFYCYPSHHKFGKAFQ